MCGGFVVLCSFTVADLAFFSNTKNTQHKKKKNEHIMIIPYDQSIPKFRSGNNSLQQLQLQFQLHSVTRRTFYTKT